MGEGQLPSEPYRCDLLDGLGTALVAENALKTVPAKRLVDAIRASAADEAEPAKKAPAKESVARKASATKPAAAKQPAVKKTIAKKPAAAKKSPAARKPVAKGGVTRHGRRLRQPSLFCPRVAATDD